MKNKLIAYLSYLITHLIMLISSGYDCQSEFTNFQYYSVSFFYLHLLLNLFIFLALQLVSPGNIIKNQWPQQNMMREIKISPIKNSNQLKQKVQKVRKIEISQPNFNKNFQKNEIEIDQINKDKPKMKNEISEISIQENTINNIKQFQSQNSFSRSLSHQTSVNHDGQVQKYLTQVLELSESSSDQIDVQVTELCEHCGLEITLRSFHCKKCKKCIPTYQFHDTFSQNCIGEKNFYLYLIFLFFEISFNTWFIIKHLNCDFLNYRLTTLVLLLMINFYVLFLMIRCIQNIAKNKTQYEKKLKDNDKSYDQGTFNNIMKFFIYSTSASIQDWKLD